MKQCQYIAKSTGERCKKCVMNGTKKYCYWHQSGGTQYFKTNHDLGEKEQKFCRCILHVGAKQDERCLDDINQNAYKKFNNKTCYNPYSVCSSKIGTSSRKCGMSYNFAHIPTDELIAYCRVNHIRIAPSYDRSQILSSIYQWKEKYEKN